MDRLLAARERAPTATLALALAPVLGHLALEHLGRVAQVLDAFAPFVQLAATGVAALVLDRPAVAAAALSVDVADAGVELRCTGIVEQGPGVHSRSQGMQVTQHLHARRGVCEQLGLGTVALARQAVVQLPDAAAAGELGRGVLEHLLQRVHQHLRVACRGEATAGVAQRAALDVEVDAVERAVQHAYERAETLERLARLVHRLAVRLAFELLGSQLELAQGDALEAFAQLLGGQQRELATRPSRVARPATVELRLRQLRTGADRPGRDGGRDAGRERRENAAMPSLPRAPWWTVRPAANRKPATYRCPICGHRLPALSEHMLIAPEGDTRRRRHAHTKCVQAARARGNLPLKDEWQRTQPRRPSLWARLFARGG